jgi:hypothetical protein
VIKLARVEQIIYWLPAFLQCFVSADPSSFSGINITAVQHSSRSFKFNFYPISEEACLFIEKRQLLADKVCEILKTFV